MIDYTPIKPENIPSKITNEQVLNMIIRNIINNVFIKYLKDYSNFNDDLLSNTLGVNVKTFRSIKNEKTLIKKNIQVQTVYLISLIKHGKEVFGNIEEFKKWLNTEIFHFDGKKPIEFLDNVPGINFIDDRLTALEYGDNV